MSRSLLLCAVTVTLVGCGSTTWTRPDLTASDFERDRYECVRDAEIASPRLPYRDGVYQLGAARRRDQVFAMCMQARGYRKE